MSITAFPVLARILVERRMLKRPLGVLALASAAIDDISAWFLIALATAVAVAGSGIEVVRTIALAAAFCGLMAFVVRRVIGPVKEGFHRVAWDLRYPPPSPIELKEPEPDVFSPPPPGPLAAPGQYTVRLAKRIDGVETNLGDPQTFNVVPLYLNIMQESDRAAVLDFQKNASKLQRAVMGADKVTADALTRVQLIRRALDEIAGPDPKLVAQVNAVDTALRDINDQINGDAVLRSHNEPFPASLLDRVNTAVNGLTTTSAPTATHRESLAIAQQQATQILDRLRKVIGVDLANIENQMNVLGAPWTPGRIPELE